MEGYSSYPQPGAYPPNRNSYQFQNQYHPPPQQQQQQQQQPLPPQQPPQQMYHPPPPPSAQQYAHQAYQPPATRQLRSSYPTGMPSYDSLGAGGNIVPVPQTVQQYQPPSTPTQSQHYASFQQTPYQPPHAHGLHHQVPLQQQQQQQQQSLQDYAPQMMAQHQIKAEPDTPAKPPPKPLPQVNIKTKFPVARIKRIMQADEDVGKVAQVTPVIVSKALELFMVSLVTKASEEAKSRHSKRITAGHLKLAVMKEEQFDFLQDVISKAPDMPAPGEGGDAPSIGKKSHGRGSASGASGAAAASAGVHNGEDAAGEFAQAPANMNNIIEEDGAVPKKRRGRKKKVNNSDDDDF